MDSETTAEDGTDEPITPVEEWEQNNDSFNYEPPEGPPESWSSDEYTALFDRVVGRRVEWVCEKCSKPYGSLRKVRRHVESQHSETLIDSAVATQEADDE